MFGALPSKTSIAPRISSEDRAESHNLAECLLVFSAIKCNNCNSNSMTNPSLRVFNLSAGELL